MYVILIKKFILPKSKDKDEVRSEFILNILLVGSIILAFVAFVKNIVSYTTSIASVANNAVPPYITFLFLLFFCFLLFLSRKGKIKLSALILILFLTISSFYTSWRWGVDIPQALLVYALVIVMSGILLGTRATFIITAVIGTTLILLSLLQKYHVYELSSSWRIYEANFGDAIVLVVNLIIIALVSWLFNREMERALIRARKSEEALKLQRDQLEIIVAERTQELKKVQVEKLMQLYRFAEFGKLSSGLVHELVTPLNIITLNLKRAQKDRIASQLQAKFDKSLDRAMQGTQKLEKYLLAARKQIQSQDVSEVFSLTEEINNVIQIIAYRARKEHVKIVFDARRQLSLYGNPLKLNQLITNLVINSIDAYDQIDDKRDRKVEIRVTSVKNEAVIAVQDWGCGIDEKDLPHIYDPLFTTKSLEKGTGIGLSLCKEIIEKYFNGTIRVSTKKGFGTTFTISFAITGSPAYKLKKEEEVT